MKAICILSWKNPKVLTKTLETYKKGNLFDFFDEKLIFFQEITNEDKAIAKKFNIQCIGTEKNIGIAEAWELILKHIQSNYVLMLENDCPLIESRKVTEAQLKTAYNLLSSDVAKIVRLRHTKTPGDKFETTEKYKNYHTANFQIFSFLRKIFRPFKAKRLIGIAPYVVSNPEQVHHNEIRKFDEHSYLTNSSHINWTNQFVMFDKEFVLEVLLERVKNYPSNRTLNGFQDIERALNCSWWRKNKFSIGICKGLFTHDSKLT